MKHCLVAALLTLGIRASAQDLAVSTPTEKGISQFDKQRIDGLDQEVLRLDRKITQNTVSSSTIVAWVLVSSGAGVTNSFSFVTNSTVSYRLDYRITQTSGTTSTASPWGCKVNSNSTATNYRYNGQTYQNGYSYNDGGGLTYWPMKACGGGAVNGTDFSNGTWQLASSGGSAVTYTGTRGESCQTRAVRNTVYDAGFWLGSGPWTIVCGAQVASIGLEWEYALYQASAVVVGQGPKGDTGATGATGASGSGALVKRVYCETAVSTTYSSAQIPFDNSKPQSTEGAEALTCSITPTSASDYLNVFVQVFVAEETNTSDGIAAALFQDSTADALSTDFDVSYNNGAANPFGTGIQASALHPNARVLAGSTSSTTFKVRVGLNSSNTVRVNGAAGAKFNGSLVSYIVIDEVLP